jgi:hypothetical protein
MDKDTLSHWRKQAIAMDIVGVILLLFGYPVVALSMIFMATVTLALCAYIGKK